MWWAVFLFFASAAFVDLAGYWLHRWAHRPSSPLFGPHMTHHVQNYPPRRFFSERYESSGSDSLAIWFAPFGAVYVAAVLLLGAPHPVAILLGGAASAAVSSVLHDFSHVRDSWFWRVPFLRGAGVRHHWHHRRMQRNFGVVFSWWDRLFGTTLRRP